jgi:hypothetical protein
MRGVELGDTGFRALAILGLPSTSPALPGAEIPVEYIKWNQEVGGFLCGSVKSCH